MLLKLTSPFSQAVNYLKSCWPEHLDRVAYHQNLYTQRQEHWTKLRNAVNENSYKNVKDALAPLGNWMRNDGNPIGITIGGTHISGLVEAPLFIVAIQDKLNNSFRALLEDPHTKSKLNDFVLVKGTRYCEEISSYGTAMHYAVRADNIEAMQMLLDAGANRNAVRHQDGYSLSPMAEASMLRKSEVHDFLKLQGAKEICTAWMNPQEIKPVMMPA